MNDKMKQYAQQRHRLIQQLTENIVEATSQLRNSSVPEKDLKKAAEQISERLEFEANTSVNELVTRFSKASVETIKEKTFERFGKNFRYQHILMFVSVIFLIITGIPLKFPSYGISKFIIIDFFGGLEISTLVHRIAATGLIIVGVWHLGYTFFSKRGWKDFILMIPRPKDIIDFIQTVLYNLGRRSHKPKFGRFSFIEKFDYWAVYWGMIIMIGSGLILWFKEMFPRYAFDIAREAHSDEGLLATLAIVVWHFYNVHFNPEVFPMSWVWWHGNLTESEIKHHHPLEYAEIIEKEREALNHQENHTDDDKSSNGGTS